MTLCGSESAPGGDPTMASAAAPSIQKEIEVMSGKDSLHEIEEAEKKPLWQRLGWLGPDLGGQRGALFIVASLHAHVHERRDGLSVF
jgi:hypothetical protein